MGYIVRSPSRGPDSVDSGLLSLVEQENYGKQDARYNNTGVVGIEDTNIENDTHVNMSHSEKSHIKDDSSRLDALSDLMANLSSGSDKSHNSSNSSSAWQVLTS